MISFTSAWVTLAVLSALASVLCSLAHLRPLQLSAHTNRFPINFPRKQTRHKQINTRYLRLHRCNTDDETLGRGFLHVAEIGVHLAPRKKKNEHTSLNPNINHDEEILPENHRSKTRPCNAMMKNWREKKNTHPPQPLPHWQPDPQPQLPPQQDMFELRLD